MEPNTRPNSGPSISENLKHRTRLFLSQLSSVSSIPKTPNQNSKMGAKAKKAMKKQLSKAVSASAQKLPLPSSTTSAPDFLPLEGGPARKLPAEKPKEDVARVVYISHIPHGFYENEMRGFFGQFGVIKRLRIVRNKKTGKSKHYGFIEFEDPGVAKIVAETMDKYLLFEHLLQVLLPPEKVHPKLWKNSNIRAKPLNWVGLERKRHGKERTLEGHKKLVEKIKKRDLKRQKKIEAAGIEYGCPEIVTKDQPAIKKKLNLDSVQITKDQPALKKLKSDSVQVTKDQPAPKKKSNLDSVQVTKDQPAPKKSNMDSVQVTKGQPAPKKKLNPDSVQVTKDQPAPKKKLRLK